MIVIEGRLDTLELDMLDNVAALQSYIDSLNATLLSVEGQLSGLDARVTNLEDRVYDMYDILNLTLPSVAILHPANLQPVCGNVYLQAFILEPYLSDVTWTVVNATPIGGGLYEEIMPASGEIHIWDSTSVPDGIYNLTITVTNVFGHTATKWINITAQNTGPFEGLKVVQMVQLIRWFASLPVTDEGVTYDPIGEMEGLYLELDCQEGSQLMIMFSLSAKLDGGITYFWAMLDDSPVFSPVSAGGLGLIPISTMVVTNTVTQGTHVVILAAEVPSGGNIDIYWYVRIIVIELNEM